MTDWRAVGYGFVVMPVGLVGGPLGSLLGGAGVFVVGPFLTLLFAIDSALAGPIGGVVGE